MLPLQKNHDMILLLTSYFLLPTSLTSLVHLSFRAGIYLTDIIHSPLPQTLSTFPPYLFATHLFPANLALLHTDERPVLFSLNRSLVRTWNKSEQFWRPLRAAFHHETLWRYRGRATG